MAECWIELDIHLSTIAPALIWRYSQMIYLIVLKIFLVITLYFSLASAQDRCSPMLNHDYSSICGYEKLLTVSQETALDIHDYFLAIRGDCIEQRGARCFLMNVDTNHLNKVPGHIRGKDPNMGTEDLKYVLKYFPNHVKALMLMNIIAKLTNNPLLPIPYYERAIKFYPQYALTHAQFGAYLVDIGRADLGMTKLKRAIEMDP